MLVLDVQPKDSVIHICISILFQILFPYGLLQNIEQSILPKHFLKISAINTQQMLHKSFNTWELEGEDSEMYCFVRLF